jgi:GWxTD domain-containing protein
MRSKILCTALVAAGLVCSSPRAAAAGDVAQCLDQGLGTIAGASTRSDSSALIERFSQSPPGGDRACAGMLSGYLIGMTSSPAEDTWRDRQRGSELLEAALRSFGDEPRLYLAMGVLYHHRQSRTDAFRMLDRAEERADRSAVPLTPRERALIWYRRGLIHQDMWRDVRSYGRIKSTAQGQWHCGKFEQNVRDNFTSGTNDHEWLVGFNFVCPDQFAENMGRYYEPRDPTRVDDLTALEDAFSRALELDPTLVPAVEGLLAEYVYLGEWEKVERVARRLREQMPDDYRSHLFLALVLHETARDSLAGPEFGRAFVNMPEDEARRLDDIAALLTPEQRTWLESTDSSTRRVAATAYWNSLDPLYLTRVNERKIEHYARVVAADLMFTAQTLGERGADTYPGRIWIRYGRPLEMRELEMPTGRVVFWDYGPGPDITFTRGLGYQSYRWTDQGLQYTESLQKTTPQAYEPRTLFDELVPLEHQVVRTLDYQARPQLLIYTGVPADFAPESEAAFVLMDAQFQPAAQWRGKRPEAGGLRAELNQVARGSYSLTVEVWDRARERVGRLRDTITTLAVTDSSFMVSDLLLAGRIAPGPGTDDPTSRRELDMDPLYGTTLPAGATLGLYWEMYRFNEPEGRVETDVHLEVLDAGGRSVFARVLRGVGITGEREPAARVRYQSTRPLLNGRAIGWLELGGLSAGEYRIRLRLTDRDSGREVVRERNLVVS